MNDSAPTALIVDDEPQMVDIVSFALETQGFATLTARDAESAWQLFTTRRLDLLVLDIMLPQSSGLTLCRRIRESSDVPIILLTARGEVQDRVIGLESGADDYVSKPFHPRELALRAEALVRRSRPTAPSILACGDLLIENGHASIAGKLLPLSDIELRLLKTLAATPGTTVPFKNLLMAGWQLAEGPGGREMLKTAIYRLRIRLAAYGMPRALKSVRGEGYQLTAPKN